MNDSIYLILISLFFVGCTKRIGKDEKLTSDFPSNDTQIISPTLFFKERSDDGYYFVRMQGEKVDKFFCDLLVSDWEPVNKNSIILLNPDKGIFMLELGPEKKPEIIIPNNSGQEFLELSVYNKGVFIVCATREDLRLEKSWIKYYSFASGKLDSLELPQNLNYSGITASRNGGNLAFSSFSNKNNIFELYILNLAKSKLTRLSKVKSRYNPWDYSLDNETLSCWDNKGNFIYYEEFIDEKKFYLKQWNVDSRELILILDSKVRIGGFAYLDEYLFFPKNRNELYMMNINNLNAQKVYESSIFKYYIGETLFAR